ncbi:MAG: hypothetical protein ABI605_11450 [Rhizobacter sp.]
MNLSISKRLHCGASTLAEIKQRLQVTPFHINGLPTSDGVQMNVQARVRWYMPHARKASMSLVDSRQAVASAATTFLSLTVRASPLWLLLTDPAAVGAQVCQDLAPEVISWGAIIRAVEVERACVPPEVEAENDARLMAALTLRLSLHRPRTQAQTRDAASGSRAC